MTEPKPDPVHGDSAMRPKEHAKELSEDAVFAHQDDTRRKPKYLQSNEGRWENAPDTIDASDDDLPLARRRTGLAAPAPTVDPDKSQISGTKPERKRPRAPPPWETTQVYQDAYASPAFSTIPLYKKRGHQPPSREPTGVNVYQGDAMLETDEEMARRLQEQLKREASLSGTGSYNAHRPAAVASDGRFQWGGLPVDRNSDVDRMQRYYAPAAMQDSLGQERYYAPAAMQDSLGQEGSRSSPTYPVHSADSKLGRPADENTRQSATAFGTLRNDQAIGNSLEQQRPAYIGLPGQSTCWENRSDHLPFRTSCDSCIVQRIECSKHNPSFGYCYQHGPPRNYSPGLIYNARLQGMYDALHEEEAQGLSQISGVRKRTPKKMRGGTLRELRPKPDERGPPMA